MYLIIFRLLRVETAFQNKRDDRGNRNPQKRNRDQASRPAFVDTPRRYDCKHDDGQNEKCGSRHVPKIVFHLLILKISIKVTHPESYRRFCFLSSSFCINRHVSIEC
nr:MAG TPA: hypothetical protein [Caudoviricetes sp.]